MGAWFSFSGHFLQRRKAKTVETFRTIPENRLLIETDAPDMLPPEEFISHPMEEGMNHPANLARIAKAFAASLGMTTERLAALTAANHAAFFNIGGA